MKYLKEHKDFDFNDDDFDFEEEDEKTYKVGNYKVGDYVVVKGWDYGGYGNGIEGIIISKLYDKDDRSLSPSGLLHGVSDFVVIRDDRISGGRRISVDNIIRHATTTEINVLIGRKKSYICTPQYIINQGWDSMKSN